VLKAMRRRAPDTADVMLDFIMLLPLSGCNRTLPSN
jgi:hypothetical protein